LHRCDITNKKLLFNKEAYMKKHNELIMGQLKMFLAALFLLSVSGLRSQEIMNIEKTDNTVIRIPVPDIKSIYFTGGQAPATGQTISDVDGNIYQIVTIGHQVWMAENLRTTRFNDGTAIKNITIPDEAWANTRHNAYCWYLNNADNKALYGALYNWAAVKTGKLCPEGWHVPYSEEWLALVNQFGTIAGARLKEKGTAHWKKNTDNVTNETGFTALPGGQRQKTGTFASAEYMGTWWTQTEVNPEQANSYNMFDYTSLVIKYNSDKTEGHSIRCIRD